MVTGADGLVYVATGDAGGSTGVVRFDPAQASPTLQTYVNGLPAANALDFDATGSLYVTTEALGLGGGAAPSVLRVRPDGSRDTVWENAAGIWGANGVVAKGGDVFATVSFDQRSPIWEIPIADPAGRFILTELSLGALSTQPALFLPPKLGAPLIPKGLDDLTVGPDGALWVAAFSAGEVLRVDPGSGRACVVASGLVSPTAIRFPVAFGGWSPTRDAFVTEAAGELLRVHVTPAP
jgi:sugar lactone lactonase YvrE